MLHQSHVIRDFNIVAPFTLRLTFTDGIVKTIYLEPMLRGELYGPLHDLDFFNQVKLDSEAGTIVWPNKADFNPATLHDWDEVGPDMIQMAATWQSDTDLHSAAFDKDSKLQQDLKGTRKLT